MNTSKSKTEFRTASDYKPASSQLETIKEVVQDNAVPNAPQPNKIRRVRRWGRIVIDFGLTNLAFYSAFYLRFGLGWGRDSDDASALYSDYIPTQLAFAFGLVILLHFYGFYNRRRITGLVDEVTTIFKAVLVMSASLIVLVFLTRQLTASRLVFAYLVPITLFLLVLERYVVRRVYRSLWVRGIGTRKLLIVGATDAAQRVMSSIVERPNMGYHLVGYVDDEIRFSRWKLPVKYRHSVLNGKEVPYLGKIAQLNEILAAQQVDEVIIALPAVEHDAVNHVIGQCRWLELAFTLVPDVFQLPIGTLDVEQLNGVPLISLNENKLTGWNYALKRTIDITLALAILLVASPVMLITTLAIKRDSKGPVLFRQVRVGKNGKTFQCLKFRSMVTDAEAQLEKLQHLNEVAGGVTFKMKHDPRVTRVGRFIRKTSIDELPQLFNILLGQMSFIGPRPATEREVMKYEPWHMRRLEVTPGLSGLWQVSGRSRLSFEDMVKLDIYYAEHWSIWLDLKIMLRTPLVVLKGDGAS